MFERLKRLFRKNGLRGGGGGGHHHGGGGHHHHGGGGGGRRVWIGGPWSTYGYGPYAPWYDSYVQPIYVAPKPLIAVDGQTRTQLSVGAKVPRPGGWVRLNSVARAPNDQAVLNYTVGAALRSQTMAVTVPIVVGPAGFEQFQVAFVP